MEELSALQGSIPLLPGGLAGIGGLDFFALFLQSGLQATQGRWLSLPGRKPSRSLKDAGIEFGHLTLQVLHRLIPEEFLDLAL